MSANTLLRSLPRSSAPTTLCRKVLNGTRTYATKDETPKPNLGAARVEKLAAKDEKSAFRAQLYESTAERTRKERADRDRHAKERQEGGGGRNIATTFGMFADRKSVV